MKITPESVFAMSRRTIIKALGVTAAFAVVPPSLRASGDGADPALTAEEAAASYNNFYEFGFGKEDPARTAVRFNTDGWVLEVGGLVKKPLRLSPAELEGLFGLEERVYRMRCVEGWSMVIPWRGFALGRLLALAEPLETAKYAGFASLADPEQMPEVRRRTFPFPYLEGLRLDEAMHPLTILATGAYGKALRPQCGAPLRLVVPWKYGFKSIKSLVSITLTEKQPPTTWDTYNPREYGFYSNVNPQVPHRRWSQASERVIGPGGLKDVSRRPTLLFNGYGEVAELYRGMDLSENY